MKLTRRHFARALGFGAIAAPFLRIIAPPEAHAAPGVHPRRLIVFFTPNGTWPAEWFPSGGERDFAFRRILAPLTPFRDRVIVTRGIGLGPWEIGPGDEHDKGPGMTLTGSPLRPVAGCSEGCTGSFPGTISIDQAVATHLGAPSGGFRSIELGARVDGGETSMTRISYTADGTPLPPENSPLEAYARIFRGFSFTPTEPTPTPTEPDPAVARELMLRRSILDANVRSFQRLGARLAPSDRALLDRHLTHIRELEMRIGGGGTGGGGTRVQGCMPYSATSAARIDQNIEQQIDILVLAMQCGLTHVASMMCQGGRGNADYPFAPVNATEHHDLSHAGAEGAEQIIRIDTWLATQYARILERLATTPEGEGTMLDNTLVLWVNELGTGDHSPENVPYILGGNVRNDDGTPHFRSGRYVQFPTGTTNNDLMLSIARAFGMSLTTFGMRDFSRGPLSGLT